MPGFNGTGPNGAGAMTGGARGPCNPAFAGTPRPMTGYGYGRGAGFGFGRCGRSAPGRGFGYGFAGYQPGQDQVDVLKQQAEALKNALDDIQRRIAGLEKE